MQYFCVRKRVVSSWKRYHGYGHGKGYGTLRRREITLTIGEPTTTTTTTTVATTEKILDKRNTETIGAYFKEQFGVQVTYPVP